MVFQRQIVSFAFFFNMIHKLTKEKLEPLKADAFITASVIMDILMPSILLSATCNLYDDVTQVS